MFFVELHKCVLRGNDLRRRRVKVVKQISLYSSDIALFNLSILKEYLPKINLLSSDLCCCTNTLYLSHVLLPGRGMVFCFHNVPYCSLHWFYIVPYCMFCCSMFHIICTVVPYCLYCCSMLLNVVPHYLYCCSMLFQIVVWPVLFHLLAAH